ncbi:hypothetical protein [Aurantimonas sp. A3-2-R12]|uniref:hypothetical protein n=1 Tax=Aurantimonas sp. A3-2-R12 TaxID=3114362 RepID=UPI002E1785DD|nr:hypothetical protein [Aurantimonas sp. A3-2-R12]
MSGIASKASPARERRAALRVVNSINEDGASAPPSICYDDSALPSFTSWKLDLLETVNADPQTDPFCLAVLEAYLHFANRKSRTAYLAENDLIVRTSLVPRVLRKAKQRLVKLGYLKLKGKSKKGVVIYAIDNPRRGIIHDHMLIAAEKLKDMEAEKKERERLRRANGGSRSAPPIIGKGGADWHLTGGADQHPKHLYRTPTSKIISERESDQKGDPWRVYVDVLEPLK